MYHISKGSNEDTYKFRLETPYFKSKDDDSEESYKDIEEYYIQKKDLFHIALNYNLVPFSIKDGVLDPQGKAVTSALHSLGYKNADNARIGKYITLTINAADKAKAEAELKEMCDRLLTNPNIEKYSFELAPVKGQ